jgi:N-acetylneuraminate lyase
VDERNAVLQEWVVQAHKNNIFVIAHVGHSSQPDAIGMAKFAVTAGADAIAAVPPYYEHAGSNVQGLIDWFKPVLAAAPGLPFYYYHIPGSTYQSLNIYEFVKLADAQLPTFKGIKNVDGNQGDFLNCVSNITWNNKYQFMWAPEPKLQSFGFPGRGTILAESFYAGTFLRMWDAFNKGNMTAARNEQNWKFAVENVFNSQGVSGDTAKRAVYKALCGVEMGTPRAPAYNPNDPPLTQDAYNNMINQLTALGFFSQTVPPYTPPSS